MLWLWACAWAATSCMLGEVCSLSEGATTWSPDALGDALFSRHCPTYCSCYGWKGLRRADCTERRILSIDLGLPRETEVADLGGNLISVLDDGCFQEQGLVRLVELSLRQNFIRSVGVFAFAGLRRLSALDLSYNHLQTLDPTTFAGNRGLKVLLLAGNNLARLPWDRPLIAAPNLQVLDLSDCKLPHLGHAVFSEMPALASLNLSSNYLNQLQGDVFLRMARLQMLDADKNPMNCDFISYDVIEILRERNVTLTHPCPALSAPSKHLARLLADVVPGVEGDDTETIVESTGAEHESGGLAKTGLSEKMQDLDGLLGLQWEPIIEDNSAERKEETQTNQKYDNVQQELNVNMSGDCITISTRHSGNPDFVSHIFDKIPSFWAGLLGFQVGLFVSVALTCACRPSSWRELCRPNPRLGERLSQSSATTDTTRAGEYVALERGEGEGDSVPTTPALSRASERELWADDNSSVASDARRDANATHRPETPPPSYQEVMWVPERGLRADSTRDTVR